MYTVPTVVGAGSVVLTQTHPAAPYVCRTGNITLRCQYDGVEGVLNVVWVIGTDEGTTNSSTIPGHTALPNTTTNQDVVVDSYTNLRERYQCSVCWHYRLSQYNTNNIACQHTQLCVCEWFDNIVCIFSVYLLTWHLYVCTCAFIGWTSLCRYERRSCDIVVQTLSHVGGKVPSGPHSKMESLIRFLAVILSWILSGTVGNLKHSASLDYKFTIYNFR